MVLWGPCPCHGYNRPAQQLAGGPCISRAPAPPYGREAADLTLRLKTLLKPDSTKHEVLATGQVVPDAARCVQCGICSFNCPIGIDVRNYAWRGVPVVDSHCLTCGECIARCPRGVLHFESTSLSERRGT
jgi:ferredoxin